MQINWKALFQFLKSANDSSYATILGIVGTVKPLDESSSPSYQVKTSPRLRPISTISDVIHDITDNPNRTPSRAGERKLPDIPREQHELLMQENGGSELYATLGSAIAEGGSDSEEAETEPTETNHPYAKVKKVRSDHPYATVQQSSHSETLMPNGATSNFISPRPPPPPQESQVDIRPQPLIAVQPNQPQYFSGDSQDSSKGYTSISVREPLRHIRGPNLASTQVVNSGNVSNNPNYAPVSEASDDMYAAIEDPTYLPTGNQSNSDTYAVINLPEDEIEDEVELRSAHTYSQVDKSR